MIKKWVKCGECEHFSKCNAGQARMQNVDINSKIYNEIGCYAHEQYLLQTTGKQLKLL